MSQSSGILWLIKNNILQTCYVTCLITLRVSDHWSLLCFFLTSDVCFAMQSNCKSWLTSVIQRHNSTADLPTVWSVVSISNVTDKHVFLCCMLIFRHCTENFLNYLCNILLCKKRFYWLPLCEWTAAGAKQSLIALHENGVVFRDDFESSRAFNSALWYVTFLLFCFWKNHVCAVLHIDFWIF